MAQTFKELDPAKDVNQGTKYAPHEAIPITGTIFNENSSYGTFPANTNVKRDYSHDLFQSVYDYNYQSSSANHIFDLTVGYDDSGSVSITQQETEKQRMYTVHAQSLLGRDDSGTLYLFSNDNTLATTTGSATNTGPIFMNFSRLLVKDGIQPGYFRLEISNAGDASDPDDTFAGAGANLITLWDDHATSSTNIVDHVGGRASYLVVSGTTDKVGQIFYDAGVVVVDASASFDQRTNAAVSASATVAFSDVPIATQTIELVIEDGSAVTLTADSDFAVGASATEAANNLSGAINANSTLSGGLDVANDAAGTLTITQKTGGPGGNRTITSTLDNATITGFRGGLGVFGTGSITSGSEPAFAETYASVVDNLTIEELSDTFRSRVKDIYFQNTTEINSTIYFCRANSNEFNFSSNPTYTDSSDKIRVKTVQTDSPVAYVTTVGLYGEDNELLAVAKLSEPLEKDPTNELLLRVRLDY